MYRDYKLRHPQLFIFVSAAFRLVILWLATQYAAEFAVHDLWVRMCYMAASCLLFYDLIETSILANGKPESSRLDFWLCVFCNAMGMISLLTLLLWRGLESAPYTFPILAVGGVMLGYMTAKSTKAKLTLSPMNAEKPLLIKYDMKQDILEGRFSRIVYLGWPIVSIILIVMALYAPFGEGVSANYFLFLVLLPGVMLPRYAFWKKKSYLSLQYLELISPKIVGIGLLLFGLLFL